MMTVFHATRGAMRARSPTTTSDPGNGPAPSNAAPPANAPCTIAPSSEPSGTRSIEPDAGGHIVNATSPNVAATICAGTNIRFGGNFIR